MVVFPLFHRFYRDLEIVIIIFFIFFTISSCNSKNKNNPAQSRLSKSEAIIHAKNSFNNFKSELMKERQKEMDLRQITVDGIKMKFDFQYFGKKPKEGWSLYFSLHGGGQTEPAVNEKQWVRHQNLYEVSEGIVFVPRSPTNTWNMWHQDHIDPLFNRIIQNMIMLYEVRPQ